MSKPNVLVLGGCGFIGKNFVTYLVENNIAEKIRVADKVLPATAYLTSRQLKAFDKVEFKQSNLATSAVEKCFEDGPWNWVINLAGETKYSLSEEVYEERVYNLTVNVAKQAAKAKAGVFVEVSTAQVYDADKEDGKVKPWTLIAKHKLKAEEEIKKIDGLNWVIVRPAIVYGVGDLYGITPRIVVGAVYKELKEEMKLLWGKDLRINTVHVDDVVTALVGLAKTATGSNSSKVLKNVFNLVDKGDSDQDTINSILKTIFGIQTGYQGTIISNLARLNLGDVTEEINDKHMQPWSNLCKRFGIANTPLTPYLDQELLYNNSLTVDGSKIEGVIDGGFEYKVKEVTEAKIREVIDGFVEVGAFPKGFI